MAFAVAQIGHRPPFIFHSVVPLDVSPHPAHFKMSTASVQRFFKVPRMSISDELGIVLRDSEELRGQMLFKKQLQILPIYRDVCDLRERFQI